MDNGRGAKDRGIEVLTQGYEDYVDAFDLRSRLNAELALEDDYQEHVRLILSAAHLDEMATTYSGPLAFCGGGQAAQTLLRDVASSMYKAGQQIPLGTLKLLITDPVDVVHPLMFCGMVPEGDLGVVTRTNPPGLVLFDVALWFFLRLGVQAVAAELEAATGDRKWGRDEAGSGPVAQFRERLDGYLTLGQPLRQDTYVKVMRGPREVFRRQLNLACVAWIVGHEYGHVAVPSLYAPPQMTKYSEQAEMYSHVREERADSLADALVRTPWFGFDPLAAAFAPVLVHTIQAFILRTYHAAGRKAPYWTHDVPEMRAVASTENLTLLGEMIPSDHADEQYQAAHRFREWLWTQMDTPRMFSEDVPDGITPL